MKGLLVFPVVLCLAANGCGVSKTPSNLTTTCVVCGESLEKAGDPQIFVYKDQEVRTCSPAHRAAFLQEPRKYLKKIEEATAL